MATSLEARIRRLEVARAASAARPAPSATEMCARTAYLLKVADPAAPMTPANRRACRAAELLRVADQRRLADIHSLA